MHLAICKIQLLIAVTWQFNIVMGTGAATEGKLNLKHVGPDVLTPIEISNEENTTPERCRNGIAAVDEKLTLLDIGRGRKILNGTLIEEDLISQINRSGYNPVRHLRVIGDQERQLIAKWKTPNLDTTLYVTVGYVVNYRLRKHLACSKNAENSEWHSLEVNATTTQVILNDLEDYASYNISVTPRTRHTGNGIERFGRSVSIIKRTLSSAPVANLQPGQSSKRSSPTTMVFHWNRVTCENQNGPNFTYVCALYKLLDGTHGELISEASVKEESYVVTNLEPCTSYRFEVIPRSREDTAHTEDVLVQTPPAPFGLVRDLSLSPDDESGNVMVVWQPPLHTSCSVIGYSLTTTLQRQQACPHKLGPFEETTTRINGTSQVINMLPYTTYMVSVSTHGENEELTGPAFIEVLTTPKKAPASSPALSFDSLSSTVTSLVFTWEPVPCEDVNGAFIQYAYTLQRTGSDVLIDEGNIRDQSENRISFEGLNPCTNYTFRIRVENELFQGNFTTVQGETKLAVPGEDLNFSLRTEPTCDTHTACLLATWQTPVANSCPITSQVISLYQLDGDNCTETYKLIASSTVLNSERRQVFRGLEHNSLYRATLVVSNSAGMVEKEFQERTTEAAPTGSPQHVAVRRPIRRTRVSVSWEEPVCGLRNGKIVQYSYVLRQGEMVVQTGVTHNKWHHFTNLRGGTMYSFTVNASTALGTGPNWVSEYDEHLFFMTRW